MGKIYEDTQANTNIIANNIQTLNNVIWKEIASTSGRENVKVFSSNKNNYLQKRKAEINRGYLTKEEYDWFINKYFLILPSLYSNYLMQCQKYKITEYSAYTEYLTSYKALQNLHNLLKAKKINEEGNYSINDLKDIWLPIWEDYYTKSDELNNIIIAKLKETSIVKAITEYAVNISNDVPPSWKTEEYDTNWSTDKPQNIETYQALWARTKYYYLDNTITRNRPYLIIKATTQQQEEEKKEGDKGSSAISLFLSSDVVKWTARGLKIEKEITMTCVYEDILKVSYELVYGSGITFEDTEVDNEKKIITPSLSSNMTDQIIIRAFVADSNNKTIAEATTTLKKEIVGTADPIYIGCLESVPSGYSHDGIVDNLIIGDFFLCKGKTGTDADTDFMFGVVYELEDATSYLSRSAWKVCTNTDKIAQTISDKIAIGAYSQDDGYFKNLNVSESSILSGNFTVNSEEAKFKNILPLADKTYNIGASDSLWNNIFTNAINIQGQKNFNIQGFPQPYIIHTTREVDGSNWGVILWSNGFVIQYINQIYDISGLASGYNSYNTNINWKIPFKSTNYFISCCCCIINKNGARAFSAGYSTKYTSYINIFMAKYGVTFSVDLIGIGEADETYVNQYLENPSFDF